jgi:hypothetical protein
MRATRAVFLGAGALLLLGLWTPAGCGPNGVRKVVATKGGTGGQDETGGTGGGDTAGTGGGMAGKGGTGGMVVPPDAAPDVGRDVAADLAPIVPDVGPDLAPDVNPVEAPPPDVMGAPCATAMNDAWVNNPFPMKAGMFTVRFDGTPSSAGADAVMGLSNGAAAEYNDLAVNIRFATTGNIDARNGGAYAAAATVPYMANMKYDFRIVVNVTAHTYSVFVTPPGGQEQTLAMGYAFRTQQNNVTSLNSWAVSASPPNSAKLCNFAVQ